VKEAWHWWLTPVTLLLDQEDLGSKPEIVRKTYLEKSHHKKGMVEWAQGVSHEFKP
jgi:Fe-S cluster biosynthesis and repair protein YggX